MDIQLSRVLGFASYALAAFPPNPLRDEVYSLRVTPKLNQSG